MNARLREKNQKLKAQYHALLDREMLENISGIIQREKNQFIISICNGTQISVFPGIMNWLKKFMMLVTQAQAQILMMEMITAQ